MDNTTDCLNISALDDDDFESPEFFTVSLESPVSSGGVALSSPSSAIVNIEDNESMPLKITIIITINCGMYFLCNCKV